MEVYGTWFCGNKISDYGLKHGYVDYETLGKAVPHVLNNKIISVANDFKPVCKYEEDEDGNYPEVFQWFIVSDAGAEMLKEAGECVWRSEELDINLWGVTHFGTSWDYVLTDIKCNTGKR